MGFVITRASLSGVLLFGGLVALACYRAGNGGTLVGASAAGRASGALAGGGAHTCALTEKMTVACWGRNSFGELGTSGGDHLSPFAVPSLVAVSAIAAGGGGGAATSGHSCALVKDGVPYCWGSNDYGQLGDGTRTSRPAPAASTVVTGAVEIGAGMSHTCARTDDGAVWCWGRGDVGQLGTGSTSDQLTPARVPGIADAVQIAVGWYHTCARLRAGEIACWGRNAYGEIGTGTRIAALSPVAVVGLQAKAPSFVAAGNSTTCAIFEDGSAECWGDDQYGQLGDGAGGPQVFSVIPVSVAGMSSATRIGLGGAHGCALLSSGKVACWGSNGVGQLGIAGVAEGLIPTEIPQLDHIVNLEAGASMTIIARADATLWAWGANGDGQLGDGTQSDRPTPTKVLPLAEP